MTSRSPSVPSTSARRLPFAVMSRRREARPASHLVLLCLYPRKLLDANRTTRDCRPRFSAPSGRFRPSIQHWLAQGRIAVAASQLLRTVILAVIVTLAATAAGGIASIAGFGIGSILTPLLATALGTKLAVAVVSVPHFVATALRFFLIREHLNRRVLLTFGITSATGGLAGALLHTRLQSVVLGYVLGGLLVFAGITGLTSLASRMRFGRTTGWVAGALSGIFGGLVGNQGGIRSAALLGFDVSKEAFVATATGIALLVDVFRMPVYAATQFHQIVSVWPLMVIAIIGVVVGTLAGKPLLARIPEPMFRRLVALIILALGVWMLARPGK